LDLIPCEVDVTVAADGFLLVTRDNQVPVLADPLFPIVQNPNVQVLLTVNEDLLAALLIFEADFVVVVSASAFGTAGL
jgi:hypothetical protein